MWSKSSGASSTELGHGSMTGNLTALTWASSLIWERQRATSASKVATRKRRCLASARRTRSYSMVESWAMRAKASASGSGELLHGCAVTSLQAAEGGVSGVAGGQGSGGIEVVDSWIGDGTNAEPSPRVLGVC